MKITKGDETTAMVTHENTGDQQYKCHQLLR